MPVLVVDHASGGKVTQVTDVLSQAGFDITPGVTSYPEYPKKLAGNVIAYAPDADAKAQVVAKYFPSLELQEVEGLPDDVVVFVDATYKAVPVGGGSTDESTCPEPNV